MSELKKDMLNTDISDEEIDLRKLTKKSRCISESSKHENRNKQYMPKFIFDVLSNDNYKLLINASLLIIICFVVLVVFNKYNFIKPLYYNMAAKAISITLVYTIINYSIIKN